MHFRNALSFILIGIILSISVQAQERPMRTPADILLMAEKALSARSSVSYTATSKFKFFDRDDTLILTGKLKLLRNDKDSIFNGCVWYTSNDTLFQFYDLENIYWYEKEGRKATRYFPHKGEVWPITGSYADRFLWRKFLDPSGYAKIVANEELKLFREPDTLLDGIPYAVVRMEEPDEEEFSDVVSHHVFSLHDGVPILVYNRVKYQGNYQYRELWIQSYLFDTVTPADFSPEQIADADTIADYIDQRENNEIALLEVGSLAPLIPGAMYPSTGSSDSVKFRGAVTVVDFWYMACYWCIKAMPALEKIHQKYRGRNVRVIGINSYDNEEKARKRIPKFLEHNPITYPLFMTTPETPEAYKVSGWPTLYIIDAEGRIRFRDAGYSEDLYDRLSKEIDKLLE